MHPLVSGTGLLPARLGAAAALRARRHPLPVRRDRRRSRSSPTRAAAEVCPRGPRRRRHAAAACPLIREISSIPGVVRVEGPIEQGDAQRGYVTRAQRPGRRHRELATRRRPSCARSGDRARLPDLRRRADGDRSSTCCTTSRSRAPLAVRHRRPRDVRAAVPHDRVGARAGQGAVHERRSRSARRSACSSGCSRTAWREGFARLHVARRDRACDPTAGAGVRVRAGDGLRGVPARPDRGVPARGLEQRQGRRHRACSAPGGSSRRRR